MHYVSSFCFFYPNNWQVKEARPEPRLRPGVLSLGLHWLLHLAMFEHAPQRSRAENLIPSTTVSKGGIIMR